MRTAAHKKCQCMAMAYYILKSIEEKRNSNFNLFLSKKSSLSYNYYHITPPSSQ